MSDEYSSNINIFTANRIIKNILNLLPENPRFLLILDDYTRMIVNNACGQFDLFDEGCVDIDFIDNEREKLECLDVVYLINWSESSLNHLHNDFSYFEGKDSNENVSWWEKIVFMNMSSVKVEYCLYDRVYILFPRPAPQAVIDGIHNNPLLNKRLKGIETMNCDFIPIEPQLFSLGIRDAFEILYGPTNEVLKKRITPSELIEEIAQKLLTFCITINENPIIRYKHGSINENLAKRFSELMEEYKAKNPQSPLFQLNADIPRGEIIFLDRQFDMVTPFLHEATYQGMTYDLLPITDEREYQYQANVGGVDKVKTVLLNYEDTIWSKYSHVNIQNALTDIVSQADLFKSKTAEMQQKAREGGDMTGVADLLKSVGDIGKLSSLYNLHIHILSEITNIFKDPSRGLFDLIQLEQMMASDTTPDGSGIKDDDTSREDQLKQTIECVELNLPMEDKTRLLLLYIICLKNANQTTLEQCLQFANLMPKFRRVLDNISLVGIKMGTGLILRDEERKARKKHAKLLSQKAKKTNGINIRFEPFVGDVINGILDKTLPVGLYPYLEKQTKLEEADTGVYRTYKKEVITIHNIQGHNKKERKDPETKGNRIILFMSGGGTYAESRSVYEHIVVGRREIIFGATEILKPNEYLDVLHNLSPVTDTL